MKLLEKASDSTKEIVIARHNGVMFGVMESDQLLTASKKILADLSVASGIQLPDGPAFSQLSIFVAESLKDDYTYLTVPLAHKAFKKYATVLTVGKEKSYGRTLSLTDVQQILNEYGKELDHANEEVKNLIEKENIIQNLNESEKQNIIRSRIQEKLNKSDFDCTYVDYNQLLRDGLISEEACNKQGWKGLQELKKKYLIISESIFEDNETMKGVLQKRNVQDKLDLLKELEDEVKGEIASLYLQYAKKNNLTIYINNKNKN